MIDQNNYSIKEMSCSQKLGSQMISQFQNEAEKKLLMQNYILGKLVSDLQRKGYLTVEEVEIEGETHIVGKIFVAKKRR